MLVYSSQWKPPRFTALFCATNTPHKAPSSCFFVHHRASTASAPCASSQSWRTGFRKKNLKYQGLHVTKKKKKTARHRQVSQSRTLLKQKKSIF